MEDKITSIVSRKDIVEDAEVVIAQVNRIYSEFQKVRTLNITLQSSGSGKEVAAGVNSMTQAMGSYTKVSQEYVRARQTEATAIRETAKASAEEAKTLEQNIQLRRQLQNTTDSYKASLKDDLDLLKNGTITRAEYNKRVTEGQVSIEKYKSRITELNKEIKAQTLTEKQLNARHLADQKALNDASNEYKQLSLAYNEAALRAKNYSLTLGASHPVTVAAVSDAKKLGDQLKAVDASVGQNQRKVGDYSGALSGFFSKILGGLRTVANLIPGLGLGGLIGGIVVGFKSLYDVIAGNSGSVTSAYKLHAEIQQKAAEGYVKEITKVELLKKVILDSTVSVENRKKAVAEYNEVADKTNQIEASSIGNSSIIEAAMNRQIELIKKRALARAAENLIADKAEALIKKQLELEERYPESGDRAIENINAKAKQFVDARAQLAGLSGVSAQELLAFSDLPDDQIQEISKKNERISLLLDAGTKQTLSSYKKRLDLIQQFRSNAFGGKAGLTVLLEDIDSLQKELQQTMNVGLGYISEVGGDYDGANTKNIEKIFKMGDDIRKANYETQKRILEDDRDIAKQIYDNEQMSFDKRSLAAEIYNNKLQELRNLQYDYELSEINRKEVQDKSDAQKEYKLQAEQAKALKYITESSTAQRKALEVKYNSDIREIVTAGQQEYLDRYKKFTQKQLEEAEKHLHDMQDIQSQELSNDWDQAFEEENKTFLTALTKAGANQKKREAAEKKHNDRLLKLQTQYQVESLKQQIEFVEQQLEIDKARAEATGDQTAYDRVLQAESKIAALRIRMQKTASDFLIAKAKETKSEYAETIEKIEGFVKKFKEIAQEVGGVIGDFISAGAAKEKNAIQEQMDLIDKRTAKEIEAAEQTSVTEQEKADKVALINARAAAQKQQLEIRQRQADERNARFQKSLNIAQAIGDTTLAVLNQLKTGNPLTAIARAIAVGAIGAARIAALVATPIPRYFKGRNEHDPYEGPALVGDGGKRELIIRKAGSIEVTPDRPALTHVRRGDIVLPDADHVLKYAGFEKAGKVLAGSPTVSPALDHTAINKNMDRNFEHLTHVIKNKKEFHPFPLTARQKVLIEMRGNKEYYRMNGFDVSNL